MNKEKKSIKRREFYDSITPSLVAILVGLVFGLIIMIIANPIHAPIGFITIIAGGISGGLQGIGDVLYTATPLILTGLSVGFAFKTGLFNIGASGQLIVGAYVAVLIGVYGTALGAVHWLVALLAAIIAGAIWASVPGILKAFFNVNEVISCIMMNYIGMYLVNILVVETVYDKLKNQSLPVAESANMPKLALDKIFAGSSVNSGFIVAIIAAIIVYIILYKTVFGYELCACGHNPDASRYAGINSKRNIVFSMMIAGALAGCAGGLIYLSGSGIYIVVIDILASEGFMGIPIALLGLSNPIGILFAAIFIGYITMGGFYMQLYNFAPEIIDIIISAIIYFSAFTLIVKNYIEKRRKLKEMEEEQKVLDNGGQENE